MFTIPTSAELAKEHRGGLYLALQMYLKKTRGPLYQRKLADEFKYTAIINDTINGGEHHQEKFSNILMGLHM